MTDQNNNLLSEGNPTLLFVDYAVPQYDLYAGSRTNFMYLEMLVNMGLQVKFLSADFQRVEPYSSELNQLGIETLDGDWFRDNWESWLEQNGQGIDYVFFHKPDPAVQFLQAVQRHTNAAIIYQCHDLHYLRLRRKAELENDSAIAAQAEHYEEIEDLIFSNSDVLLTFSQVEANVLEQKYPHKQVLTVPLFIYPDAGSAIHDFSSRHDLLFVGSCAHTPNRDAISWFCSAVLPIILNQLPDIVFNVVGADPDEDVIALESPNIRVLGRLSEQELQDLYKTTRMMVVPLRYGAGVKGKVIEAFYNGVPLVSTTIGLEGIIDAEQLMTAHDDAADFAARVIELYQDENELRKLGERGTELLTDTFTVSSATQSMRHILALAKEQAARRLADDSENSQGQAHTRLIALYLPQYHPIPENDEWWGEGFTEWQNVRKAEPQFQQHYQPHIPSDLGYYDLRVEETRVAQAELAKKHGIEGFCYYHYWFNGKRLLEQPLKDLLSSGKPDFPFCLCWANENWTRRWDGEDQQVLMRQEYSEEDDRRHIRSLLPVFKDERYIRVNGKPLFLVYRTEDIPNPARMAEIWREEAREAGVGELYLCRVKSMGQCNPKGINFDAAMEFAPDWWNKGPQLKGDAENFAPGYDAKDVCDNNFVHDYRALGDTMMAKSIPDYKWFRCVTPGWDNWARRTKGANIFVDSTPEKYQSWLYRAINNSHARLLGEERLVFINAWNEWAEGNHLEPDQKHGHAYLEATRQAVEEIELAAGSRRVGASDDVKMGHLTGQLVNYKYRLQESEGRVALRDQQIADMMNSTSWRLTVPVRWIKQHLIDLKKRFSG